MNTLLFAIGIGVVEYARCMLWFVYLPIVAMLVRLGVKYKMPSERRKRKKRGGFES